MCRVKNNLNVTDPVSIHWHGILQRGSVIMDGVAGVTQRAIPEGASQLYNFICDLPGTYWVRGVRCLTTGPGWEWGVAGQGSAEHLCNEGREWLCRPIGGSAQQHAWAHHGHAMTHDLMKSIILSPVPPAVPQPLQGPVH
jgi:hypothetical protein